MFNPENKIVLIVANPSHHMGKGNFFLGIIWSKSITTNITSRVLLHIDDIIQLICAYCATIVPFYRCLLDWTEKRVYREGITRSPSLDCY